MRGISTYEFIKAVGTDWVSTSISKRVGKHPPVLIHSEDGEVEIHIAYIRPVYPDTQGVILHIRVKDKPAQFRFMKNATFFHTPGHSGFIIGDNLVDVRDTTAYISRIYNQEPYAVTVTNLLVGSLSVELLDTKEVTYPLPTDVDLGTVCAKQWLIGDKVVMHTYTADGSTLLAAEHHGRWKVLGWEYGDATVREAVAFGNMCMPKLNSKLDNPT